MSKRERGNVVARRRRWDGREETRGRKRVMVGRIIPRRHVLHVYTYLPTYTLRAVRVRLINTRQCVVHSREKVRKSASVRDSHARRICLKFPRETRGPPRRRSRVAREQTADRESFVRRTRAVHVAATRLEPPPSFPPLRSLKCQIIGRTYVRSFCAPVPPHFFPIHYLLFLQPRTA